VKLAHFEPVDQAFGGVGEQPGGVRAGRFVAGSDTTIVESKDPEVGGDQAGT